MQDNNTNAAAARPSADTAGTGLVSLSADSVATELDRLADEGVITAADKALMMWLFGEIKRRSLSYADAGKLIGYDPSTVSRILRGRYEGNWANVLKAIRRYKHLSDERGRMVRAEFVETSIWQQVRATCDLALVHQMPSIIMGVSQIGKTHALLEYQRRSEYTVRYVRMPAAAGFRSAMEAVADACYITTRCTAEQLRRRVAGGLDERSLLIVDELHQLAISTGRTTAIKVMEWLRELHDVSGCGLVVCGTKAVEGDLINGELKAWLDQFAQRCIRRLVLPERLPDADIAAFGAAFGLPAPSGDILDLLRTLRANRLVKTLQLADNLARRKGQALTWDVFAAAHNTVNN